MGSINALATAGDDLYLVGTSTAFGASHIYQNDNLLAVKMSGGGDVAWIRSLGKKKISVAHSEYGNEMGNGLALGPDGSMVAVGGTDAFALPDPGFSAGPNSGTTSSWRASLRAGALPTCPKESIRVC